uniref:Uncharacterized protein n=1 Tax=Oryza rufipogon TaxID=4529 RepID=A0A0E0NCM8_ORYRU
MVECRVEPSINSRGSDASVQKQGRLVCDLSAISDGVLHISSSVMPTEIIKRYFKEKSCLLDLMELGNKSSDCHEQRISRDTEFNDRLEKPLTGCFRLNDWLDSRLPLARAAAVGEELAGRPRPAGRRGEARREVAAGWTRGKSLLGSRGQPSAGEELAGRSRPLGRADGARREAAAAWTRGWSSLGCLGRLGTGEELAGWPRLAGRWEERIGWSRSAGPGRSCTLRTPPPSCSPRGGGGAAFSRRQPMPSRSPRGGGGVAIGAAFSRRQPMPSRSPRGGGGVAIGAAFSRRQPMLTACRPHPRRERGEGKGSSWMLRSSTSPRRGPSTSPGRWASRWHSVDRRRRQAAQRQGGTVLHLRHVHHRLRTLPPRRSLDHRGPRVDTHGVPAVIVARHRADQAALIGEAGKDSDEEDQMQNAAASPLPACCVHSSCGGMRNVAASPPPPARVRRRARTTMTRRKRPPCRHAAPAAGWLTCGSHLMTQPFNGVKDATWDKTASETARGVDLQRFWELGDMLYPVLRLRMRFNQAQEMREAKWTYSYAKP